MNMFSLRTLIDDILLIVRNNNISESEDFSRAQIAAWILHYKAALIKKKIDEDKASGDDTSFDESLTKMVGPLLLEKVESLSEVPLLTRQTVETIDDLLDKSPDNIISVFDQQRCPLQFMHGIKRHFHYNRKYTSMELTYDYEDGHILVQGNQDRGRFKYIWVKYIASGDDSSEDEDEITIPGWMIPEIKNLILKNELSFMIKMPSDDDNNSTLDGIKPHGPQDQEK